LDELISVPRHTKKIAWNCISIADEQIDVPRERIVLTAIEEVR
jgi:hypothetical protein